MRRLIMTHLAVIRKILPAIARGDFLRRHLR